jgi:hypothetical protein
LRPPPPLEFRRRWAWLRAPDYLVLLQRSALHKLLILPLVLSLTLTFPLLSFLLRSELCVPTHITFALLLSITLTLVHLALKPLLILLTLLLFLALPPFAFTPIVILTLSSFVFTHLQTSNGGSFPAGTLENWHCLIAADCIRGNH